MPDSSARYEIIAKEKFTVNYVMKFNASKDYLLCFKNDDSHKEKNTSATAYFIYDLKNDVVLIEETIGAGKVEWLNDHQVEISSIPGIVKGGEKEETTKQSYIYDLKLKKKLSITNDKDK